VELTRCRLCFVTCATLNLAGIMWLCRQLAGSSGSNNSRSLVTNEKTSKTSWHSYNSSAASCYIEYFVDYVYRLLSCGFMPKAW
jgi:hypothetical protein